MSFSQKLLHTLYLVGDAGNDTLTNKNLRNLQSFIEKDSKSTSVFLGDNIYPDGLNSTKDRISEKKITAQLTILNNYKGNVFFVPGNHDWKAGKWFGLKSLRLEERFIETYLDGTFINNKETKNFIPQTGFPGPYSVAVESGVRIIAIDIQWWLQRRFFYPIGKNGSIKEMDKRFFYELDSLLTLSKRNKEFPIIIAHHPLFSNGHHGAKKQPLRFIINYTPLQVFGLLGLNRLLSQDIQQPRYRRVKRKLLHVINKFENVFYIAGHEHTLQYFKVNGNHHIVSGSGSKLSKINHDKYSSIYKNDSERGFFILELFDNQTSRLTPYLETGGKGETINLSESKTNDN